MVELAELRHVRNKHARYAWLAILAFAGCTNAGSALDNTADAGTRAPGPLAELGQRATGEPRVPPPSLGLDACDDDLFSDTDWSEYATPNLRLQYLPGTHIERLLTAIGQDRERAFIAIADTLGISDPPIIHIYLSPSRASAAAHNVNTGAARPADSRYDIVYPDAVDSYEVRQYGHEMTHVLSYSMTPMGLDVLSFMSEGLAEFLDQSGRNLHLSYARMLVAGAESSPATVFDARDLDGRNYGRAGSFVQMLVEQLGISTALEVYRAAAIVWAGCELHAQVGCVDSPETLRDALDASLEQAAGKTFSQLEPLWQASIDAAKIELANTADPAAEDIAEVELLLANIDWAVDHRDAARFRSTMDGFYCDWKDEDQRRRIAARAVSKSAGSITSLTRFSPIGYRNFQAAIASTTRINSEGNEVAVELYLEHLPEIGWRITWSPDWQ